MHKSLTYTELFYSIQGEGRFVGVPSVFLRLFLCNFQCHGFGQSRDPALRIPVQEMEYMTMDISNVTRVEDLPVPKIGCDSSVAWAKKFKHLSKQEPVDDVADKIIALLPNLRFSEPLGQEVHLVITGGEPLLPVQQKALPDLLDSLMEKSSYTLRNITFETNGTQTLTKEFIDFLNSKPQLHVTFSVSTKLSVSGELFEDAVKPVAVTSYSLVKNHHLYFKFVVRDKTDLPDVTRAMKTYAMANVAWDDVYLMPEGALLEGLQNTEKDIVELCMSTGYRFSPRLHVNLFGNSWGS